MDFFTNQLTSNQVIIDQYTTLKMLCNLKINNFNPFYSMCHSNPGADWTVGKSVIYRIKFIKKKKKKEKKRKKKKKKREKKERKKEKKHEKKKNNKERPENMNQKGPLTYVLNLTEKGLQIFMRRISPKRASDLAMR